MVNQRRRKILGASAVFLGAVTAGCFGNGDDDDDSPGNETDDQSDTTPSDDDSVFDDEDQDDEWSTVTPDVSGATQQPGVDAKNTGWLLGTELTSEPSESWSNDLNDLGVLSNGVVYNDTAYYVNTEGELWGLDVSDGDETVAEPLGLFNDPTVVVANGHVFVSDEIDTEDFLTYISMREADGEIRWDQHLEELPGGGVTADADAAFLGSEAGELYKYETEVGEEVWESPATGDGAVVGHPAITDDFVVFTTENAAQCYNRADGSESWSLEVSSTVDSSPVIYGDVVLIRSSATIGVFELESGDEVWGETIGDSHAGVAVADQHLLIAEDTSEGPLHAVNVYTGDEEWEISLGAPAVGHPTVVDGTAYVATQNGVVAIEVSTGSQLWSYSTDAPATAPVVVADDRLLVETEETLLALS